MTSYMALRLHLQTYLRVVSIYIQLQLHLRHWQWPPKKVTTLKKRCTLATGIGNSFLRYLLVNFIIPTTIAKKFAYAEANCLLNVTIEGGTISERTKPTYLDV